MIGFFDSGFGGLQTMKDFQALYPEYSYIFLADNKNCPFGRKEGKTIKEITFKGINRLFNNGAKIVILACNTAAAYAIRDRQNKYPEKKVLSITIPGIEKILKDKPNKKIGILATQATILSNIYTDLFHKFGGKNEPDFSFVMAPNLVDLVESGEKNEEEIDLAVQEYINKFPDIDVLILGCTHFPLLIKNIEKFFPGTIVNPSEEAARQFGNYLERHPEIKNQLQTDTKTLYFTTGSTEKFSEIGSDIVGKPITADHIIIE